ncbi:MAG: hypothetical protein AAGA58_19370, partial [Verrucomicrobiota bacterium]
AVDDGWRDWDIELRDSRFWRVRLTTVTEYHGDRGRLLRLRFASRVTRLHVAGSVLLAALMGSIVFFIESPLRMLWLVGLWLVWWIFLELLHRGQVEQFMLTARRVARDLGFVPGPVEES